MAEEAIRCLHCQSETGVKYGRTSNGKARYRCQQTSTCGRTFIRTYAYPGRGPEIKRQIVEMTLNGRGVRDIARVLQVSPTTGIGELKKRPARSPPSTKASWKGAVPTRAR
jgi:transposase-like protein